MKTAVIYWSGTGNTEEMANAVAEGAKDAGAEVDVFEVDSFDKETFGNYDGFMFGCPAMGDEVLEEGSFEPFFADIEKKLANIPVALFGSYGWGGGAWMRIWEQRVKDDGAKLVADGLAVENAPDDAARQKCKELGAALAKA